MEQFNVSVGGSTRREDLERAALSKLKEWYEADEAARETERAWRENPTSEMWDKNVAALRVKWERFDGVRSAAADLYGGKEGER